MGGEPLVDVHVHLYEDVAAGQQAKDRYVIWEYGDHPGVTFSASPASPSLIATLTGPAGHVYSVAFAPAGGQLAASSDDGTVHLWDTNPATAEAAICANLGQPLTTTEWSAYVPDVPYHAPCS